ncbi:hypothetical protein FSP39_024679 [Pinctada imbricata]|uniref:Homeobox domain-containing protein n=1 Tax=Pinctada imbricata TaxID=66713 RepID=A0AA89C648_PINIB|nr:hypothetical protein FSP39_024679 [Pinctada imbricata]
MIFTTYTQKKKKARTAFTTEQINELEKRYQVQKYLPANERSILAERLGLADQQVKTWFQNRRMKEKRQQRDDEHARSFALPTGGVDVSQLAALGMPCPPPYNIQGTPVHSLPGFPSPPVRIPKYKPSSSRSISDDDAISPSTSWSPVSLVISQSTVAHQHKASRIRTFSDHK